MRPSKRTASHQRRYNVAATSWRCSDVVTTLCVCWNSPYKFQFETWLNENRELLSHDVIREKENQLKLYTEIVDVYEQMDDNDDDEKARADMNKVQALIAKISAIFGQLPAEVLSAQVLCGLLNYSSPSRKHTYIILTPLNPTFI